MANPTNHKKKNHKKHKTLELIETPYRSMHAKYNSLANNRFFCTQPLYHTISDVSRHYKDLTNLSCESYLDVGDTVFMLDKKNPRLKTPYNTNYDPELLELHVVTDFDRGVVILAAGAINVYAPSNPKFKKEREQVLYVNMTKKGVPEGKRHIDDQTELFKLDLDTVLVKRNPGKTKQIVARAKEGALINVFGLEELDYEYCCLTELPPIYFQPKPVNAATETVDIWIPQVPTSQVTFKKQQILVKAGNCKVEDDSDNLQIDKVENEATNSSPKRKSPRFTNSNTTRQSSPGRTTTNRHPVQSSPSRTTTNSRHPVHNKKDVLAPYVPVLSNRGQSIPDFGFCTNLETYKTDYPTPLVCQSVEATEEESTEDAGVPDPADRVTCPFCPVRLKVDAKKKKHYSLNYRESAFILLPKELRGKKLTEIDWHYLEEKKRGQSDENLCHPFLKHNEKCKHIPLFQGFDSRYSEHREPLSSGQVVHKCARKALAMYPLKYELFKLLKQNNDPLPLVFRLNEIWTATYVLLKSVLLLNRNDKYVKSAMGSAHDSYFKRPGVAGLWNKECWNYWSAYSEHIKNADYRILFECNYDEVYAWNALNLWVVNGYRCKENLPMWPKIKNVAFDEWIEPHVVQRMAFAASLDCGLGAIDIIENSDPPAQEGSAKTKEPAESQETGKDSATNEKTATTFEGLAEDKENAGKDQTEELVGLEANAGSF